MFVLVTIACFIATWVVQLNWIRRRHEVLDAPGVSLHVNSVTIQAPGLLWIMGEVGHQHLAIANNRVTAEQIEDVYLLFPDPDSTEFEGKFEVERREVFARRKEIVAACQLILLGRRANSESSRMKIASSTVSRAVATESDRRWEARHP